MNLPNYSLAKKYFLLATKQDSFFLAAILNAHRRFSDTVDGLVTSKWIIKDYFVKTEFCNV